MPTRIHLEKAPITEALLDIRVNFTNQPEVERLKALEDLVSPRFHFQKARFSGRINIKVEEGALHSEVTQSPGGIDGYFFTSADQKKIIQARLDGFTFSRLNPYESWEVFEPEARELWEHYLHLIKPTSISRIALRYINRIELPFDQNRQVDFKHYLKTIPEVSPDMPQLLANFFMRLVIPQPTKGMVAIVTQAMEPTSGDHVPIIFDIDVFREAQFSVDTDDIWAVFKDLHAFKNEIFFGSLTARAIEIFK
jgi:uncharacterized protein (TIGR04255 family)